jgi:ABC-type amino acid transport system permease subunit
MHDDTESLTWLDYALATIIGLCLAMAALSYFDVLTKV